MSPRPGSSSHRKRNKKNSREFWSHYSWEVSIVVLFLGGVYLLVEQTDVSQNILSFLRTILRLFARVFESLSSGVTSWIETTETSDIVGYILILMAFVLLGYRARGRLMDQYPNTRVCPDCNSQLSRVHRKTWQRLISFLLKVRIKNYHCSGAECNWQGFQVARK